VWGGRGGGGESKKEIQCKGHLDEVMELRRGGAKSTGAWCCDVSVGEERRGENVCVCVLL
jgi:hypothetical protein